MGGEFSISGPPGGDRNERARVEDEIDELLGTAGENVGAGSGIKGWDLSYELDNGEDLDEWVGRIVARLRELGVRPGTFVGVFPLNWEADGTYRRVEVWPRPDLA